MIPHLHLPVARAVQPQPCGRPGHHPLTVAAGVLVTVGACALGLALGLGFAGRQMGAFLAANAFVAAWVGAVGLLWMQHRREAVAVGRDLVWVRRERDSGMVFETTYRPAHALTVIRGGKDPLWRAK